MSDQIESISFTDDILSDHDSACAIQASRLLEAGCLEYEIAAYATAVYVDGEICYYISAREDNITKFVRDCYLRGLYPTPVKYYCKRYDLMEIDEDKIRAEFRHELALKLKNAYPREFFESLYEITNRPSVNNAMPLLQKLMRQLDCCFDPRHLKIFESLLDMLLSARHISLEGYNIAKQWVDHEYDRLAIEPMKAGKFQKNYAGFAYIKTNNEIKYFIDAFGYMAKEKQAEFIKRGYLVSPILEYVQFADSFSESQGLRDKAKREAEYYLDMNYMHIMKLIRQLPVTVDKELFDKLMEDMKTKGYTLAVDTLKYYGYLWNITAI